MSMPTGFKINHWSDEDVMRLQTLWRDLRDDELASLLGRTKKAVKEKRERLGLIRFERAT